MVVELNFDVRNVQGVTQRMLRAGDLAAPYFGAAMRRSMFAYRRDFIRGQHKSDPVKFGRGKNSFNSPKDPNKPGRGANAFVISTFPRNERTAKLDELRVEYHTASTVAAALESGARVRPRGGKWLAIPTGVALKPNGKTRRYWSSPAMLKKHKANVRIRFAQRRGQRTAVLLVDVGNVRGRRRKLGPLTRKQSTRAARRKDKPTRWRPAWNLVPRAVIPAKLGFLKGWDRLGPKYFDERAKKEFDRYMREVWGQR